MTEAFNVKTRLAVGPPGRMGLGFNGEDFRTTFDVTRDVEREPNSATFEITNLSRDSRSVLEAEDTILRFEAGYGADLFQLFLGEVARVDHVPDGVDVVTRIECDDGAREYATEIRVAEPPGSTLGAALANVCDEMGLTLRVAWSQAAGIEEPLVRGYSYIGDARGALSELLDGRGISWSIQNRVVEVWPDSGAALSPAPFIAPDTGLVGWAVKTRIDLGSQRGRRSRNSVPGVRFESLLLHNFQPGGRVQIEAQEVSGVYRIHRVRFNGDSFSDAKATVEAIES